MGCIHSTSHYPLVEGTVSHYQINLNVAAIYNALPSEYEKHRVIKVYDGDTMTLQNNRRVRFLGIDTPELAERQPYAEEAKRYTAEKCLGKDIYLSFEPGSEKTDRYGRLLAWVWIDQETGFLNVNEALVSQGYASIYTPGKKKLQNHDKLMKLQTKAKEGKLGKWKMFKDFDAFITRNGKAFHKRNCKHLSRSTKLQKIRASKALDRGLYACRTCLEDI